MRHERNGGPDRAGLGMRAVRVPLRLIEQVFGPDRIDDAGDEILALLRRAAPEQAALAPRFRIDADHANPWYHALVVEIDGLPDATHRLLLDSLAHKGLSPADDPD